MLKPVRTVAPTEAPISLAEAKAHISVDFSDDDVLIASLIDGAVAHLDGWTGILGRCIVTQTWSIALGDWPACGNVRLPFPDVSAVVVTYYDADDVEQTVSASGYELLEDSQGAFIRFRDAFTYPEVYGDRSDGVRVTLTAGFGAASAVPEAIKLAVKMLVAEAYEARGATMAAEIPYQLPFGVSAMIEPYRRVGY